ncbi:MAG: thiamine pyrophosphate-dependent dehydrogenase E1 component subunit alpha [Terriglobia bacterium]
MELNKKTLLDMLYYMKLTREIENRIERKLYRQGKILGGVYVGRGQEAIAVGSSLQLEKGDCICPSHRDMGAFLIRGVTPHEIFAQYMGRRTGICKGKDGNLHMGDMRRGIVSFVSMLADTVPVAAGIGMALKMRKQNNVVLCYFGDGATSRGDWHEGINLASVHKVPVVYLCNNNLYAYSTPLDKQMGIEQISTRAAAYGIPGITIDGNDVMGVFKTTKTAIEQARNGGGPTLIECRTFRMTGHSAHDDMKYVPKGLVEEWEKKDPILRLETHLIKSQIASEEEIRKLATRITRETDEAVERAENDPFPSPEETLNGVYADQTVESPLSFADAFFTRDR